MVTLSSLAKDRNIGGSCASSSFLDCTHLLLLQHGHRLVTGLDQVARIHLGFEVQPLQCMVKELVQNSCAGLHGSTWRIGISLTPGGQDQTCTACGCLALLCSSNPTRRPSNFGMEVKPADIEVNWG